jgi:hypothetical protein
MEDEIDKISKTTIIITTARTKATRPLGIQVPPMMAEMGRESNTSVQ